MPTVTIPITAYSVQAAAPSRRYGQLASLPVRDGVGNVYFRAPLGTKVPTGATVVSAKIRFWGRSNETGSRTDSVQPVSVLWTSNVTWTTRPAVSGAIVSLTKTSPQSGTLWEWVVTTTVQEMVSGTRTDRGWRLTGAAADTGRVLFAGSTSATNPPVLVVEYTLTPPAPENLHPASGAMSVAKPTVTFDAVEDITNLQVQVDPAMSTTNPEFDSGTVAAAGGYLDLAALTANLLPASQGNAGTFDTDINGWSGSNCTVARVTTPTQAGAGAISLTASTAANMSAQSSNASADVRVPVTAGQTYHVEAYSRAATTARSTRVQIQWLDATGAQISLINGTSAANSTSAWGLREMIEVAPAGATHMRPLGQVLAPAAGEVHYWDTVTVNIGSTNWPGVTAGATTYWRTRQKTAAAWSPWSEWVAMTRLAKAALTLLNPPTAVDDTTPPIQWSFAGVQVAWQARLLDAAGDVLADSGYTPGTDTAWTPDRGLTFSGQTATVEVLVWDDAVRSSIPGDPDYVMVTRVITYTLDATVDPVTTIAASQSGGTPDVTLTGTRTAIPDEVDVYRDGNHIARYVGTAVFVGNTYTITDRLPPLGRSTTYRVAPRVNGKTASGGPTATITPRATGIWLEDSETGERALIYTETGVPEQAQTEAAIVHSPLNEVGGLGQVVRRRLIRFRPSGAVTGVLMDRPGSPTGTPTQAQSEARLAKWANQDAGHRYYLLFSGFVGTVIIGDVELTERDNPRTAREVGVKFNYWGQS